MAVTSYRSTISLGGVEMMHGATIGRGIWFLLAVASTWSLESLAQTPKCQTCRNNAYEQYEGCASIVANDCLTFAELSWLAVDASNNEAVQRLKQAGDALTRFLREQQAWGRAFDQKSTAGQIAEFIVDPNKADEAEAKEKRLVDEYGQALTACVNSLANAVQRKQSEILERKNRKATTDDEQTKVSAGIELAEPGLAKLSVGASGAQRHVDENVEDTAVTRTASWVERAGPITYQCNKQKVQALNECMPPKCTQ